MTVQIRKRRSSQNVVAQLHENVNFQKRNNTSCRDTIAAKTCQYKLRNIFNFRGIMIAF